MQESLTGRLAALGGVARRRDLVVRRGDVAALQRALSTRAVVRVAHGIYGLPGWSTAAAAAVAHGAALGCVTAVGHAGIAVLQVPVHPHLSVPRSRGRTPSTSRDSIPAVLHRESGRPAGRVVGVRAVPLESALARMLVCCTPGQALVSIDNALHLRRTTAESILRSIPATAAVRARLLLGRADERSRSPLETVARLALRGAGLRVEPGVVIPMVGEVDLVVEGRVVVELDGLAYHSGRREFTEDRRRDRELAIQGFVVLRFTAQDVLADIARVVATVRAALAAPRRR
ncbi:endonuclease domain-containing protein [Cellulomonas fengjieae]|uniref:endonuclease domain-containing protein n=1 Tax=Cellulomonas fengjieae TaxID=2819978 RepID=UPI001AAF86B4|nr:DUF559 domain-containing protein [Cellulomonas fengjieae]MBO3100570.1 DUF559 domain-containing protein [Cellulomonas fengjieae]